MLPHVLLACATITGSPGLHSPAAPALLAQEPAKAANPFDEVIRRTDALQAFVVEYALSQPGEEELVMRIAYAAPGSMLITRPDHMFFRIQDGKVDFWSRELPGAGSYAHFDIRTPTEQRGKHLEQALQAAFPAARLDQIQLGFCGPTLLLQFPGAAESADRKVHFSVNFTCPRKTLLAWLHRLRDRTDGKPLDGGRMSFEESGGNTVVLSMESGFVESVERATPEGSVSFRLRSLDLAPTLDAASFAVPEPEPGWTDRTSEVGKGMHWGITLMLRRWAMAQVARLHAKGAIEWNEETRGRVAAAIDVLYSDALELDLVPWTAGVRTRIETYETQLRERLAELETFDAAGLGRIEVEIREQRRELESTLQQTLGAYWSGLARDAEAAASGAPAPWHELERAVLDAAFERVITQPLLDRFDERVAAARK